MNTKKSLKTQLKKSFSKKETEKKCQTSTPMCEPSYSETTEISNNEYNSPFHLKAWQEAIKAITERESTVEWCKRQAEESFQANCKMWFQKIEQKRKRKMIQDIVRKYKWSKTEKKLWRIASWVLILGSVYFGVEIIRGIIKWIF